MTNREINSPVTPEDAEPKVLFPPSVNFATCCVNAFHETVAPSVKVASGATAAAVNFA